MFFKNAILYRFTKPFLLSAEQLDTKLQEYPFQSCGPQEAIRFGWISPIGRHGQYPTFVVENAILICLCKEEKILPPAVVNEYVADRVDAIWEEQNRRVRRREREEIKDQVIQELLPKAFSKKTRTYAYVDLTQQLMVVNAGSEKLAEEVATSLRKTIGSLPIRPPALEQAPSFTFTGWLNESIPLHSDFNLGTDCVLKDGGEDGGQIRGKSVDLTSDEVRNHLNAGMQAVKLAVGYQNALTMQMDEKLHLKSIKFSDTFQEKLDDIDAEDALAKFSASFSLMVLEFRRLVPALLEALGGEDRSAIDDDPDLLYQGVDLSSESDRSVTVTVGETTVIAGGAQDQEADDPLYGEAVLFVTDTRRVSVSSIQRKFKIGYNRSCNLVESMEAAGVVSRAGHNGAREVLAPPPNVSAAQ